MGVNPPVWAAVLEAANGDPLRAQEIENRVTGLWWARWLAYRNAKAEHG